LGGKGQPGAIEPLHIRIRVALTRGGRASERRVKSLISCGFFNSVIGLYCLGFFLSKFLKDVAENSKESLKHCITTNNKENMIISGMTKRELV
jgi:hypothetical protein